MKVEMTEKQAQLVIADLLDKVDELKEKLTMSELMSDCRAKRIEQLEDYAGIAHGERIPEDGEKGGER